MVVRPQNQFLKKKNFNLLLLNNSKVFKGGFYCLNMITNEKTDRSVGNQIYPEAFVEEDRVVDEVQKYLDRDLEK